MLTLPPAEGTFLDFSDLLTGYRLTSVLMLAHAAGVFAAIDQEGREEAELCTRLGWEPVYGDRFLQCLCGLGLLKQQGSRYFLSRFAATYLHPQSGQYQGKTLAFEQQLHRSWGQLAATLQTGQRVFATEDKDPQTLRQAFATYLGAMDEAARIRAKELWDGMELQASTGTILDIGAGSGAFLHDFLTRYPGWRGVFCDLPEIVADNTLHQRLAEMADRLNWCSCNLLANEPSAFDALSDQSCDLVLLSNIIHCQGDAETDLLLRKAAAKTAECGVVVIHDFFSDSGWRGALYDIHMMLNTFNGKTYSLMEMRAMAASHGLRPRTVRQLASGSTALIFTRKAS